MSLSTEDKDWIKAELERFADTIVERMQDYISATPRQRSRAAVLRMMEIERQLSTKKAPDR